ncbi:MAG TPA: biotin/lipoyl-containing protein, partial [Micromonosporaceae bacterium]|nr:biotin/lipoyl-containing protein [Micromonosporaceae bacterium]
RHVEVQILGLVSGEVIALGERDCSVQRRHQKVVEETPSPLVDDVMRARLCDAASAAAKAVGYVGAGTVEFLADGTGRFHFLEMNTRLQVEHPITECVTGLDLVAWQIRIAEGERLPADRPGFSGHAVEVRLYAEDPARDWQPQAGTLHRFSVPGVNAEFGVPARPGLRLDSGIRDGLTIGTHYDPMLAKLIAWAPTRAEAVRRLASALASTRIHGPTTNRDLLVRVLRHPRFRVGDTDTGFLARHDLTAPLADGEAVRLSALAAALADAAANRAAARALGGLPNGWRNVPSQPQIKRYRAGGAEIEVRYRFTRRGLAAEGYEGVRLVDATANAVTLEISGVTHRLQIASYPGLTCVDSDLGPVTLRPVPRFPDATDQVAAGSLLAPMPGTVTAVHVAVGDRVAHGTTLMVLEAMKMRHPVSATEPGVVASLPVGVGSSVDAGAVLVVVEPDEGSGRPGQREMTNGLPGE